MFILFITHTKKLNCTFRMPTTLSFVLSSIVVGRSVGSSSSSLRPLKWQTSISKSRSILTVFCEKGKRNQRVEKIISFQCVFHVAPCFFSVCCSSCCCSFVGSCHCRCCSCCCCCCRFLLLPRRCCCSHPSTDPKVFVRPSVRPSVGSQSQGIVSRVSAVFQSAIANWLDGSLIRFLGS